MLSFNCDLKYSPLDGGSVTWHEPLPARTTSNTSEVLPPGIVQGYAGDPVTLNWNYSLAKGLGIGGFIKFNSDTIVTITADSSAGPITVKYQERFSLSSTLGRASLSISPVTVADDRANGGFSCELIDSNNNYWKRTIQVQVLGKLESVAHYKKDVYCYPIIPSGASSNAGST